MSKQPDEELSKFICGSLPAFAKDGKCVGEHKVVKLSDVIEYIQTNYTPNNLVEQRCLEARISEYDTIYHVDDMACITRLLKLILIAVRQS